MSATCSGRAHRTLDILSGHLIGATRPRSSLTPYPTYYLTQLKSSTKKGFFALKLDFNQSQCCLVSLFLATALVLLIQIYHLFTALECNFSQSTDVDCTFENIKLCQSQPCQILTLKSPKGALFVGFDGNVFGFCCICGLLFFLTMVQRRGCQ